MSDPTEYAKMQTEVEKIYGEEGVYAFESTCLTEEDCAQGIDYVLERIAPALEEELLAAGKMP